MKRFLTLLLVIAIASIGMMAFAEEEKPTIRMLLGTQSFDMNEDWVGKTLEEITGWHVEYEYYSSNEQLSLEISSGSEYDLISMNTSMFLTLREQGALKNIAPLLETTEGLKENISDLGWTYVSDEEGGIYGIPNVDDAVYVGGIGYRTDIFEEYGFTEPNTIDEFYQLLVDIKEQTGMIPLTGNSAVEAVIASAFGLSYDYVVDPDTDNVISWLRLDGMKEYLAWMAKVYEEGLIDIDWPVNTGDTMANKMCASEAVMKYAAHWDTLNWVNTLRDTGYADAYFKTIVPLEDSNGKRHIAVSNGVSGVFAIPVTANDEKAAQTLKMVASRLVEENYWIFNDGYEGVHYYFDESGYPIPIQPGFNDDLKNGSVFQIGRNQFVHPFSWMARVHKTQVQWDTFFDANSKAAGFGFEGKPLTFASFPEYSEYYASLNTLCNDYFIQVIAGAESLDDYDDFVAEWEAMGGLELEEAATNWYHDNPELVVAACQSTSPYNSIFGYEIG